MKYFAEYMLGSFVVETLAEDREAFQMIYGDGPLVALLRHAPATNGAGVVNRNHWVVAALPPKTGHINWRS